MRKLTICFKLNTPIIYNEGTEWEKREDTFLEKYIFGDEEFALNELNKLNATATDRVYFLKEQKEMY